MHEKQVKLGLLLVKCQASLFLGGNERSPRRRPWQSLTCLGCISMHHSGAQEEAVDLQVPGDRDSVYSQRVQRREEHPAGGFPGLRRECFGNYVESLSCKKYPSIPQKDFLKSKEQRCFFIANPHLLSCEVAVLNASI